MSAGARIPASALDIFYYESASFVSKFRIVAVSSVIRLGLPYITESFCGFLLKTIFVFNY